MIKKRIMKMVKDHSDNIAQINCPTILIKFTGTLNSALLMSQILYWGDRTKDPEGWFYKTDTDWLKEIGLQVKAVRNAKALLIGRGCVETKIKRDSHGNAVTHYRVAKNFELDFETWLLSLKDQLGIDIGDNPELTLGTPLDASKGNSGMDVEDNPYITNNNTIDYPSITRHIIDNDETEKILKIWNSIGVTEVFSTTQSIRADLNKIANMTDINNLIKAIQNYGKILNDDAYFFTFKYTFASFLKAGIGSNKGFVHFLDSNDPFTRFKLNDDKRMNDFDPVTEHYNKSNIADFEANTYYGFDLISLTSAEERIDDMDYLIDRGINNWTFGKFWELELCIASMLYLRKTKPQPEKLNSYMEVWKEYRKEFDGVLEE